MQGIVFNGQFISFNGKAIGYGSYTPGPVTPIDPTDISFADYTDWIGESTNAKVMGAEFTPTKNITFTTLTLYCGRSRTDSGNRNSNYICYIAEIENIDDTTVTNTIMNYNNTETLSYDSTTYLIEDDWIENKSSRVYGKITSFTIDDTTKNLYEFKTRLTDGSTVTLEAGKHYIIGLLPTPWYSDTDDTSIICINYEHDNTYNKFWTKPYESSSVTYSTDLTNKLPYILFDGVVFTDFTV